MRRFILCSILLGLSLAGKGQIKAVTENGEEVLLKSDGTWKYASIKESYDTRLDTPSFSKSDKATFLVKGKRINYGIWIDPKKWTFKAEEDDKSEIEYRLSLKHEDAYCMIIPERMEMGLDVLEKAALINGEKVAPDIHVTREEIRKINGKIVKMLEMRGTTESIKFVYLGYYYSGPDVGTIQVVSYTSEALFPTYKKEMEDLLNGFITQPK